MFSFKQSDRALLYLETTDTDSSNTEIKLQMSQNKRKRVKLPDKMYFVLRFNLLGKQEN